MSDADLLEEVREFRAEAAEGWDPILAECAEDMRYVSGHPWDEEDERQREEAGRPCLTLDELNQYFNQGINDLRANPLGVRFAPTGNGANDKGAEFYQNKMREIEYRSAAQIAYITAAENMFQQGIGWVRVSTDYASPTSWDQEISIQPVMNPAQVLPGPHVWPDARDMRGLLYLEPYTVREFKRKFRGAKVVNFTLEDQKTAPDWIAAGQVDVGEWWKKEAVTRKLLLLSPRGQPNGAIRSVFKDQLIPKGKKEPVLPEGMMLRRERDVEDAKVCQYLTNGLEILETREWAGKHIPFVSFYGKILYVNGTKTILSQTRLARDAYMAYCFYRTCEMEIVGLTTKNPYWAYEGQLDQDQLDEIAKSLHEPVAVLLAKQRTADTPAGEVLPLPTRNAFTADIAAYSAGAEEMRRAIQAAMGITPLPTPAQRQNEKSGEALKRIESSSQKGNFHFVDHWKGGIQRVGQIVEDLMDKIYDTARTVWVHEADETPRQVRINDPRDQDAVSTKGDYLVTVSAGPSFESERAEASDFVDSLMRNLSMIAELKGPPVASAIFALAIKLKQLGPIGDQIADMLEPPEFKNSPDGKPPDPRLFAMQQTIQQLQRQLQEAGFVIKTKQIEGKTKFAIEQMKVEATSADKDKDREVKLVVAELGAKVDRMALLLEASAKIGVRLDADAERHHEATEAHRDRAHTSIEQAKDRAHEHIQGALTREAAAVTAAATESDAAGA
jgi:hypothetical protein